MTRIVPVLHRFRWGLGITLGLLTAIGGGTMLGDEAATDIAPFYSNVVIPSSRAIPDRQLAETAPTGGENSDMAAVDLGYARAAESADSGTADAAR